MYLIWIRELCGKERMVFEGVVSTVKQADYAFRALQDYHPEELVLEYELVDEGNFWHCFAGCGGGSVIDFWMRWRKCDFTTAVRELAEMVL